MKDENLNKIPNLFIVGAQKSGSTSLYYYISQHPEIFMSEVKEPRFFNYKYDKVIHTGKGDEEYYKTRITNINDYNILFDNVNDEKVIGEATIEYMYYPGVANDIYNFNPKAKIIIIIRNPIERAFSAYKHLKQDFRETLSFQDGLASEDRRIQLNYHQIWHYKKVGLYYEQVREYIEVFGYRNVKVILLEDLEKNLEETLKDVFMYLDVDISYKIQNTTKLNQTKIPKYFFINKLIKNMLDRNKKMRDIAKRISSSENWMKLYRRLMYKEPKKEIISINLKKELIEFFSEDIKNTQQLIKRDLSNWLE